MIKNSRYLVKDLSGKRTRSVIFIEAADRLKTWENHFKNLLNVTPTTESIQSVLKRSTIHSIKSKAASSLKLK